MPATVPPPQPPGEPTPTQGPPEPPGDRPGIEVLPPPAVPVPRRRTDRLALGMLLLAGAVVLLFYGLVVVFGGDGDGSGGGAAGGDAPARLARFDMPAGWADRTADLGGRVSGSRADFVFLGPTGYGFQSNVNVLHQPGGDGTPALDDLVTRVTDQVTTELDATEVGEPRRLTLDGEPAVAYDYRYQASGTALLGRQIVCLRGDVVVFVNFTAHERAFERDAGALDVLTASWRWL